MKKILNIKTSFFFIIFFWSTIHINAQKLELDLIPYDYEYPNNFGQNRTHFVHYYIGYGLITNYEQNIGSEINLGKSFDFEFGFKYKLKLTNWLAVGSNFSYDIMSFNLKQNSTKSLPDPVLHAKQKITFQNFGMAPHIRFNIGRRGNEVGNYIDLGYYFNWSINRLVSKGDQTPDYKIVSKSPPFALKKNQGVYAAIGISRYSIYAKYRLSALIDTKKYRDLPPLIIGVQLGIF